MNTLIDESPVPTVLPTDQARSGFVVIGFLTGQGWFGALW
jgi:hypothetical protein